MQIIQTNSPKKHMYVLYIEGIPKIQQTDFEAPQYTIIQGQTDENFKPDGICNMSFIIIWFNFLKDKIKCQNLRLFWRSFKWTPKILVVFY